MIEATVVEHTEVICSECGYETNRCTICGKWFHVDDDIGCYNDRDTLTEDIEHVHLSCRKEQIKESK